MSFLNSILRALFDAILAPFRGFSPMVGLFLISAVFGVLALVVYKYTSNQAGLDRVKRRIYAGLFEIRLFNDDLGAILRAQFDILRHNLHYLALSLVPMAWLIVPFLFVAAQLQFHYGYTGLELDKPTLVKVKLSEGWLEGAGKGSVKPEVSLDVPDGLRLDSPAVWSPSTRELAWRLAAERPGSYELGVRVGGETFTKSVAVSERVERRSPTRHGSGFVDQLLYPAEPELPDGAPVELISVAYPEAGSFAGMPNWIWLFVIFSVVVGFLLKGRFGVTL